MPIGNLFVRAILRSPAHRMLSGSTDLVRSRGRRSGKMFETPTQYAVRGDGLVILVGHPDSKTWWRNFIEPADVDVRVAGRWRHLTGHVVRGESDPETARPLLEAYLARFPRAERVLVGSTHEERVGSAVMVWCRPRVT